MRAFKNMVSTYKKKIKKLRQIPQNNNDVRQAYLSGMLKGLEVSSHIINMINGIRYNHVCNECVFLGLIDEYDLYYCPQGGVPTVIARFGDADDHYLSGLGSELYPLIRAEELAKERFLLA